MTEQRESFFLNGEEVKPGQHKVILLPLPKLYNWTPLSMPVHVMHGKKPGPVLCITSAIHGDEVNGIAVVRRLMKKPILHKLAGTIIAIPIVNIFGFLYQDRYLMDRRDLNRCFPGNAEGSVASRLAHLLVTEVISKATHMIDLHAGSLHRTNLPQVRVDLSIPGARELAESFNVPVVVSSSLISGSLRYYAQSQNIPFLLYEAGEALRFDELSIKTGVNGILSVMNKLEMISFKKSSRNSYVTAFADSSFWIRAPQGGTFHPHKSLGKQVAKNEVLANIGNPATNEEYRLHSPISGIIIGMNLLPLVHEGAALFHIACFDKLEMVAEEVKILQEASDEMSEENYH